MQYKSCFPQDYKDLIQRMDINKVDTLFRKSFRQKNSTHYDDNVLRIFIELLLISHHAEVPLNKETFFWFKDSWNQIFPKLSYRFSTCLRIEKTDELALNHILETIDPSDFQILRKLVGVELFLARYTTNPMPIHPPHLPGSMMHSTKKAIFLKPLYPRNVQIK